MSLAPPGSSLPRSLARGGTAHRRPRGKAPVSARPLPGRGLRTAVRDARCYRNVDRPAVGAASSVQRGIWERMGKFSRVPAVLRARAFPHDTDRQSVVEGKSVRVSVYLGGSKFIKKQKKQ